MKFFELKNILVPNCVLLLVSVVTICHAEEINPALGSVESAGSNSPPNAVPLGQPSNGSEEDEMDDTSFADPFAIPVLRSVAIAPTIISTSYNLDPQIEVNLPLLVQGTLIELFNQAKIFSAQASQVSLDEWTSDHVMAYFEETNSEIVAQVFLDSLRVYIIMADLDQPEHFYAAEQALSLPAGYIAVTPEIIGYHLKAAFDKLVEKYAKKQRTLLSGAMVKPEIEEYEKLQEYKREAKITQKLFRELATSQDLPYYAGGNIGMIRFGAAGSGVSTVNFGLHGGRKFGSLWAAEMGLDFFSYTMLSAHGTYHLPMLERYISFQVGLSAAVVLFEITQNLGYRGYEEGKLKFGQAFAGPAFNFIIPLLGTRLRGDIRFLANPKGTILVGTYGLEYSL